MNPLDNPLEGFSPEMYISTLLELAHVDGIHDDERDILEDHAKRLGVELTNLPDAPDDLTELPWATRVLVYRDAAILAMADDSATNPELNYLADLADRMELPPETVEAISAWVADHDELLERLDALLGG